MTGVTMGALRWTRRNLFSSPLNTALSAGCLLLIVLTVPPALSWLVFDASFAGTSRADCTGDGACWVFVKERIGQFLYGFCYDLGASRIY